MAALDLFKEQLENESRAIAEVRGLKERGDRLVWWYFLKIAMLSPDDIAEIITDGFNDQGIDALRIDDAGVVHFYNFRNPTPSKMAAPFPSVEVDKLLGGLRLMMSQKPLDTIVNERLFNRIEAMRQTVASGYHIHLVHSGTGMHADIATKLNAFIAELGPTTASIWRWDLEDIEHIHTAFYMKTLPTVEDSISIQSFPPPFTMRSSSGRNTLFFAVSGQRLAEIHDKYGELLLQQNIRMNQGTRSTNALIRRTATGVDAGDFLHYNNGVTFLAEEATWNPFANEVLLKRFQVVNGGQTIRVIGRAARDGKLKADVMVPVRIITAGNDKDFANNVTVNLNNQNRVEPSFLRSNHPDVVQLARSVLTKGWYLERREDEIRWLTGTERTGLEAKTGTPLEDRTIYLVPGLQAYVATFMRSPEIAKKNPKKIFVGSEEGGMFDKLFGAELTADNFIMANRLSRAVGLYVKVFKALKRRKVKSAAGAREYEQLLGKTLAQKSVVEQVVPQSAVFLTAIVYEEAVRIRGESVDGQIEVLERGDYGPLNRLIELLIESQSSQPDTDSWPSLLKRQAVFDRFSSYLRGRKDATSSV